MLILFIAIARFYLIPCILGQHQKKSFLHTRLAFLAHHIAFAYELGTCSGRFYISRG